MSILSELISQPGVIAAGEYSYRGDRFTYKGQLEEEQARMASIMCRATSLSVHMQSEMLTDACGEDCGLSPSRGWMVQGPQFTVCVFANVFCFMSPEASLNSVVGLMQERLADASDALV